MNFRQTVFTPHGWRECGGTDTEDTSECKPDFIGGEESRLASVDVPIVQRSRGRKECRGKARKSIGSTALHGRKARVVVGSLMSDVFGV